MKYGNFAVANWNVLRAWRGIGPLERARSRCRSASVLHVPRSAISSTSTAATPRRSAIARSRGVFPDVSPLTGRSCATITSREPAARTVGGAQSPSESALRRRARQEDLIANTLAVPVDAVFALPAAQLTPGTAWLAVACYTRRSTSTSPATPTWRSVSPMLVRFAALRLYHHDPPFWRRWHISLGAGFMTTSSFRGRRPSRVYANLLTVFVLCGLWHGASWTFVVWGPLPRAFQILSGSA